MLNIVNPFGFEKNERTVSLMKDSPLFNPYKIGEQSPSGAKIETKDQLAQAYEMWMGYHLRHKTPHMLAELNKIGFLVLDHSEVYLMCDPTMVHGEVIKRMIEEKINEKIHPHS